MLCDRLARSFVGYPPPAPDTRFETARLLFHLPTFASARPLRYS